MNPQLPSPEEQKRIIDFGIEMALKSLPDLQITGKDQEIGLRAYVAGFVAGFGAAKGEEMTRHVRN